MRIVISTLLPIHDLCPFRQLAESVRECVKNLLLVMSASGVFDARQYATGGELWELAWAVIDPFYPELRAELGTQ